MGLNPHPCAGQRCKESCKRSGQTDRGLGFDRNPERLPTHVATESREENRHVGGQAAALDVDEVAHLVDQNQNREAYAELRPKRGPIESKKRHEAEKKFELEHRSQQKLAFCQKYSQ